MGDLSDPPAVNGVLQRVVEKTNNVLIGQGQLDYVLMTNGTLLVLQNMTWNGKQGFQEPPTVDFFVPYHSEYNPGALSGAGIAGSYRTERGLTFVMIELAGHGESFPSHSSTIFPSYSADIPSREETADMSHRGSGILCRSSVQAYGVPPWTHQGLESDGSFYNADGTVDDWRHGRNHEKAT